MEDQKIFCLLENVREGECELYEKWLQNRNNEDFTNLMPVATSSLYLPSRENCTRISESSIESCKPTQSYKSQILRINQVSSSFDSFNRFILNDEIPPIIQHKSSIYYLPNRMFSNDNFQPIPQYKPPEYCSGETTHLMQPLTNLSTESEYNSETMKSTMAYTEMPIYSDERFGSLLPRPDQMSSTSYVPNRMFSNDSFQPIPKYKPPEYCSGETTHLMQPPTSSSYSAQTESDFNSETMKTTMEYTEMPIYSDERFGSPLPRPNQMSSASYVPNRMFSNDSFQPIPQYKPPEYCSGETTHLMQPLTSSSYSAQTESECNSETMKSISFGENMSSQFNHSNQMSTVYTKQRFAEGRYCNGTSWSNVNTEEPFNGMNDLMSDGTNEHNLPVFDNSLDPFINGLENVTEVSSRSMAVPPYNESEFSDKKRKEILAQQVSPPQRNQNAVSLHLKVECPPGSCDNSFMFVQSSDQKSKRLCCPYCSKTYIKLARHIEDVHYKEVDVKKLLKFQKGTQERRDMQDALRKAGQFKWNNDFTLNKGWMSTSRRPNAKYLENATTPVGLLFSACPTCLGSYSTANMRHHACANKKPMKRERIAKALGRQIEGRMHPIASKRYKRVFSIFRNNKITRLIRYDWLLTIFGNTLCLKHTPFYQERYIRSRLMFAGRLLFAVKSINRNVADFQTIFNPENYDSVIDAIRIATRFDDMKNEFGAPMTAGGIVTVLKDIGKMLVSEYIKNKEPEKKALAIDFNTVVENNIGISVLKPVNDTQARMRMEKKQVVPKMDDIKQLAQYLDTQREISYTTLASEYSYDNWVNLSELSIASLIVFNRRRVGEAQNMRVRDFTERDSVNESTNGELFAKLSDQAKILVEKFSRMKIRGKKGRPVPVLVKPDVAKCIELLLHHRENARIAPQNPFLFALYTSSEYGVKQIDACKVINKLSEQCGAQDPTTLRGTLMRKQFATHCGRMKLNDGEVSRVAAYMGHDDEIHREYYRQIPIEDEILEMSQLLETAQGKADSCGESDQDEDNVGQEDDVGQEDNDGLEDNVGQEHDVGQEENDGLENNNTGPNVHAITTNIVKDRSVQQAAVQFRKSTSVVRSSLHGGVISKKCIRKRWSSSEIAAVYKAFPSHFKFKTLPTTSEIKFAQQKHKDLQNRTWEKIKTWISNQYKSKKNP